MLVTAFLRARVTSEMVPHSDAVRIENLAARQV